MTVGELVAALSDLAPHLYVVIEGCDCIGPVKGVDMPDGDGLVVIRRYNGTNGYPGREAFPYGTFEEDEEDEE